TPAPAASATTKPADLVFNFNPVSRATPEAGNGNGGNEDDETDGDPPPDYKSRARVRWAKLREDVAEKLYEDVMKLGIKGVYGDHVFRRAYPNKQLGAHVIGYVNRQQEGVAGMAAYA